MDQEARPRTLDPYWIVAGVLVVLLVVQTLNRRWSTDFWVHEATVDRIRGSFRHPRNPLTFTHAPSEYFSPYTYALAGFGRVTAWSTIVVLQLAAVGNLVLFLVGFRLLVGSLTNRLAVTFALVATLLFWGWHPWRWSGYLNLDSIGFALPYPSMFAVGLGLFVAWALLRYDASGNRWWLALIGLGLPVVMLSHPITGFWTCILMAALGINRRMYRREVVVPLIVVLVFAVAVVLVWPPYSFIELIGGPRQVGSTALYSDIPVRLCASVVGVVALWRRWQRDRTDPLVLMFICGSVLFGFGALTSNYNLARFLPVALFPLHVGIGELAASLVTRGAERSRVVVGWVAASAIIGFVGVASALASMVPRPLLPGSLRDRSELQPITAPYGELGTALRRGSTVVVESQYMQGLVAAHGYRPLSVEGMAAFVPDADERSAASREILDPDTPPARRDELLAKYRVAGAMCKTDRCLRLFPGTRIDFDGETLVRVNAS
jgi:hypothetical protein